MSTSISLDMSEHAHDVPLTGRDLIDAWRIARDVARVPDPRAFIAAHCDCAELDPQAASWHLSWAAIYALAGSIRDRAVQVATEPVEGPEEAPNGGYSGFICQFCGHVGCRAAFRVFCEAEDGGNDLYVGDGCRDAAEAFMESTAIHRVSKVRVDTLDESDFAWLAGAA